MATNKIISTPKFDWIRTGFVQFSLGVMLLASFEGVGASEWWIPGAFLIINGLLLLHPIYRAINRPAKVVLSDHFFVLTCAYFAYYVAGALLLPFGPNDQAEYSMSYYNVDATIAMRVAGVNALGFGIALMSSALAPKRLFSRLARSAVKMGSNTPIELTISAFLVIGFVSYLYVLQFDLLQSQRDVVISGLWRSLKKLLLVAIVLSTAHKGLNARWFHSVAIFVALVHAFGGILMLNKSEVLLPMVSLMLGYSWRLGVRRVLVPAITVIMLTYLMIGGAVTTARNLSGSATSIDWDYRISILWNGIVGESNASQDGEDNPWSRFCYTPSQAAALDFFDQNSGGDDFGKMGWVFVPRFLAPGKPVITAGGPEFHYKIRGNTDSSSGHGVFVNGYYNLGLLGVLIAGVGVGVMLGCTTVFAREVFDAEAVQWLPFALMGSYMAFRIDGHFLPDYLGPFALLLYVFVGILLIRKLLPKRQVI